MIPVHDKTSFVKSFSNKRYNYGPYNIYGDLREDKVAVVVVSDTVIKVAV